MKRETEVIDMPARTSVAARVKAPDRQSLARKIVAEGVGTAFLLMAIVGSGIMGAQLAAGNAALALLASTLATGAILCVLILVFGPLSGAHFNPAVTLAFLLRGDIDLGRAAAYITTQLTAATLGVIVAHAMFAEPLIQASATARAGANLWLSEAVATFGLVATILGCLRARPESVGYAVALYIAAGYWFTASTSFANPAVTLARTMTDTFAGIAPGDAPAFVAAQLLGAVVAVWIFRWLSAGERAALTRP